MGTSDPPPPAFGSPADRLMDLLNGPPEERGHGEGGQGAIAALLEELLARGGGGGGGGGGGSGGGGRRGNGHRRWYGVRNGRNGFCVVETWDEAHWQITGVAGATNKRFDSYDEAAAFAMPPRNPNRN